MQMFVSYLLIVIILGCAGDSSSSDPIQDPLVKGEQIEITKGINVYRIPSKGVFIIRSVDDFSKLAGITDVQQTTAILGNVDFSRESVVIVALGPCNTTGYSVAIRRLVLDKDSLQVCAKIDTPGNNQMVGMAFTFPSHAVVVPKLPKGLTAIPTWLDK